MTLAKKYTLTYFLKEYTYCHCYGAIQYMIHNHNMDENWYGRTKRDTDGVYQEPRRVFKVNLNLKTQEQKPNNTEHKPDSIPQAHKTCPCDATYSSKVEGGRVDLVSVAWGLTDGGGAGQGGEPSETVRTRALGNSAGQEV